MKRQYAKTCVPLIVVLIIASFGAFSTVYATAQDQARAFIENTLPVDLSEYAITLAHHSATKMQSTGTAIDDMRFTLDSDGSRLSVVCQVRNNVVSYCNVYAEKGGIISDRKHASLIDAVGSFLEKYQNYAKIDSSNMIDMLGKIDATKDSTLTIGNTKLTVINEVFAGKELVIFNWAHTVNGVDYTSLQLVFQKNGIFDSLYDDRGVYSIGDTTVKTSSEEAIDLAMKYMQTYSYDMFDGVKVSGFNITEDKTTTTIEAYPINSSVLRPYWNVKLYLNQTYPGSVEGFTVYVWANSGELFSCTNIAYGRGVDYSDPGNSLSTSESNTSSLDMRFANAIALAAIALTVASVIILKKKKK